MVSVLAELLQRGDLDGLVREADRLVNARDWDGALLLRERCLAAAEETGKQLWGAAQYAEYRLALEAPGPIAASVVLPGAARFALGPLTEVVAQHHRWEEVADHLEPLSAAAVAQERVLRGEDLSGDDRAMAALVELPLVLQPWEPDYPLPVYREDELLENGPPPPRGGEAIVAAPGRPRPMPELARALEDLVSPWCEQSGGQAHVATVSGDAAAAVAAILPAEAHLIPVGIAQAFAWMAWATASGGAHGRRRGMAAGRSAAWWVAHVVTGLVFPADPDELEFHLEDLCWYAFDDGSEAPGWRLRLAVEDPGGGWAAAVDAEDRREEVGS